MTHKVRKIKQPVKSEQVVPVNKRIPQVSRSITLGDFTNLLARGFTKEEIVDNLGLSTSQFETLLARTFSEGEAEHDMKTPLRHFLDYVIRSSVVARDLEAVKNELRGKDEKGKDKEGKDKKWYNAQAYVMACNAQVNILDRQIRVGQELGVIHKTPEGYMLIDGQDPRDMNEYELNEAARKEIEDLKGFIDNKGSKQKKGGTILSFKATAGRVDR